jgi:glucose/arabinose dehydrogenase
MRFFERKSRLVLLVALVLVVAPVFFYLSGSGGEVQVLDCRNQSSTCELGDIQKKPESCTVWHPWDSYSSLKCNYTSQALGEVGFVADPANYVEAPMRSVALNSTMYLETKSEAWDLEFLPSGDPIWTVLHGGIYRESSDEKVKLAELEVPDSYKAGVMGLAVDPDFQSNRKIYVFYTESRNGTTEFLNKTAWINRVSQFQLVNGTLSQEKVLLKVPGGGIHNGGRIEFGPDGKLYITTGEGFRNYKASKISYLGGKILRINPDGSIPEDNPFGDSPVYSAGHRNPQGLAWNPVNGELYNSEHGVWRDDEINRVESGARYGWSGYICDEEAFIGEYNSSLNEPAREFYSNTGPEFCFDDWTMAPSGMTFVNDTGHPWHGDLFVAGLRGKHIHRFELEDGEIERNEVFYISHSLEDVGLRLRDVEYRNDSLYVLSDERGIAVLRPRD